MSKLINIGINKILPDEKQPRKKFNDESLLELKISIEQAGQLQPILVTPNHDGTYTIVDGERRFRAISESKSIQTIDAIVKNFSPKDISRAQIVSNWDREDISLLEKSSFIKDYIETHFNGDKTLASKELGKSERTINKILNIYNSHEDILTLIKNGYISDYTIVPSLNHLRKNNKEEFDEFVTRLKKGEIPSVRKELKNNPNTKPKKLANSKTKFSKHKPRQIADINLNTTKIDTPILQISDVDTMYQFRLNEEQTIKLKRLLNNEFENIKEQE